MKAQNWRLAQVKEHMKEDAAEAQEFQAVSLNVSSIINDYKTMATAYTQLKLATPSETLKIKWPTKEELKAQADELEAQRAAQRAEAEADEPPDPDADI